MTPTAALILMALALVSARFSARSAGRCWVEAKHASGLARVAAVLASVHSGVAVALSVPAAAVVAIVLHGIPEITAAALSTVGWSAGIVAAVGATLSVLLRTWATTLRDGSVASLGEHEWTAMAAEHATYGKPAASSWSMSGIDLGDLASLDEAFPVVLAVLVCGGLLVALGVWYARSTVRALAGSVPLPRRAR